MSGSSTGVVKAETQEHRRGFPRHQWLFFLGGAGLIVLTLSIYFPIHAYPFINFDDGAYVVENPHVVGPLNLSAIRWAFTHAFAWNYDPLTFLSHSLDVRLFGLNAGRHHDVNLFLHVLNSLLLWWVLVRATGCAGRSFMVAALFAVHPINVENVAWVAERKTLLSAIFFLLALDAYRWYAARPKVRRMLVVAGLYGLGLLAKPQVITLPCILLLWDYWPLRRMFPNSARASGAGEQSLAPPGSFLALLKEKVPLFIIAAIDAVITILAQHQADVHAWAYTFPVRLENAVVGYAQYLGRAVWPAKMALEYVYPGNSLAIWEIALAGCVLLAITIVVAACRQHRYLTVGWLWFLGSLLPTSGLITQPDLQASADRYAYTSFIGLFLMVCWGVSDWAEQRQTPRRIIWAGCVLVLLALATLTHRQVGFWRDSEAVWTHTLDVTHPNPRGEYFLADAEKKRGDTQNALVHLYRSAQEKPDELDTILLIASLEQQRGNLRPALEYYDRALLLSNDREITAKVWSNMGHAYADLGNGMRAGECFQEARRLRAWPTPAAPLSRFDWHGNWWHQIRLFISQHSQ